MTILYALSSDHSIGGAILTGLLIVMGHVYIGKGEAIRGLIRRLIERNERLLEANKRLRESDLVQENQRLLGQVEYLHTGLNFYRDLAQGKKPNSTLSFSES